MHSKIRLMVKEDRNAVFRILDTTGEFTPDEKAVARELVDIFLKQGEDSGYIIQVAQIDFTAAGYICYGPTPMTESTWDIYWIAVDTQKQRLGIGRSLLQFAEHDISVKSGKLVVIETSSKDSYLKTRKFYDLMEYKVIATVPDFYSQGDDKVIYTKILAKDC